MSDENDFVQSTKETLAKRAGQKCSNPRCRTSTAGPHSDDARAINIGEAAHIRGARPGSARFDPMMTPDERRVITNGIWLCRSCAALVDRDKNLFSMETLYEWKRNHEAEQLALIGGPASAVEEREHAASLFRDESPAALQLVLDRPEYWMYLLTAELARTKIGQVRRRITELHSGLVHIPTKAIALQDLPRWLKERSLDLQSLLDVLNRIVVHKLQDGWTKRDPEEILRTANLLWNACKGLLRWEEDVFCARFPDDFEDMRPSMQGWTSNFLEQMERIPAEISKTIAARVTGVYNITIHFVAPEAIEAFSAEFLRRFEAL